VGILGNEAAKHYPCVKKAWFEFPGEGALFENVVFNQLRE
jgi:hypothetical protein